MTFTPTPEQQAILATAKSKRSLLVNALAGAAKTSTLCMLASKLPLEPTICLAFNKRIAEEMAKRMPSHIQCATLNSLGHRVWGKAINKRLTVETDKLYSALTAFGDRLPASQKKAFGESFASILRAARMAKAAGYIPRSMRGAGQTLIEIGDLIDFFGPSIDVNPDEDFLYALDSLLETSIAEAYSGRIDFDDQIYMSTLFGGDYPRFPIVMIDEAQDLSPLNHKSLSRIIAPSGRLVAVGDPHQSIYAFRGADSASMPALRAQFDCEELTLSVSFRCAKSIVRNVHSLVPDFQWAEGAPEGLVERLDEWDASIIPDGAAIICRNNAPLFSCALRLIRAGRGVKLIGSDIGKALVTLLEKLGPKSMPREALLSAIANWRNAQLAKAHESRKASIEDRASCLLVFAEFGQTLEEAAGYAKHLFASAGPIQMMTGHKSKGLEFDTVFHLNSYLIPSKWALRAAEEGDTRQLAQERNLQYVVNTRAKTSLFFINLEDMK